MFKKNWFVFHFWPWFERGGAVTLGTDTGVFSSYIAVGKVYLQGSFRALVNYKTY